MKTKKPVKKTIKKSKAVKPSKVVSHEERENYIQNRNAMLEDFHFSLEEVQRDKPSVGGIIAGMDYQQFSAKSVFRLITDQEDYIVYSEKWKPPYVDIKEEKKLLKLMVKQAKGVFGKAYKDWYQDAKE